MEFNYQLSYEQWFEYQTFQLLENFFSKKDVMRGILKTICFCLFSMLVICLLTKSIYVRILYILILVPMCIYYLINWKKYYIKKCQKALKNKYSKEQLSAAGIIGNRKIIMLMDTIELYTDNAKVEYKYADFIRLAELQTTIILYQSSLNAIIISKDIFATEDNKNSVICFLRDKGIEYHNASNKMYSK